MDFLDSRGPRFEASTGFNGFKTKFPAPFDDLFRCRVEIALVNGETRRGVLVVEPPGRLCLSSDTGPLIVMTGAVVGVVALSDRLAEFSDSWPVHRCMRPEGPPSEWWDDLTDLLRSHVRVGMVSGGEWRGELCDVSPKGAEWLGLRRDDETIVYFPSAAVAIVETLP